MLSRLVARWDFDRVSALRRKHGWDTHRGRSVLGRFFRRPKAEDRQGDATDVRQRHSARLDARRKTPCSEKQKATPGAGWPVFPQSGHAADAAADCPPSQL